MKITQMTVWNTYSVIDAIYQTCDKGKLRYPAGQNVKRMSAHRESITDWLRSDKLDFPNDYDGDKLDFKNEDFKTRFETYLNTETVDFEPYYFDGALMEHADGITGLGEVIVSWLYIENKPVPEPEPVLKPDSTEES